MQQMIGVLCNKFSSIIYFKQYYKNVTYIYIYIYIYSLQLYHLIIVIKGKESSWIFNKKVISHYLFKKTEYYNVYET